MSAIAASDVHKIVLACEAGMGSSALVVSQLRKQLKGLDVTVEHTSVTRIPADADLILCHRSLSERASQVAPGRPVIPFSTFIGDPVFGRVVAALRSGSPIEAQAVSVDGVARPRAAAVLSREAVRLGAAAASRDEAILAAGAVLEQIGAVSPGYAAAMVERERSISTAIGEGFAIPHGTDESRELVRRTALSFVQFPAGVNWGEDADAPVYGAIGIAARDDAHLEVLGRLAEILIQPDQAAGLRAATDPDTVLGILGPAFGADETAAEQTAETAATAETAGPVQPTPFER